LSAKAAAEKSAAERAVEKVAERPTATEDLE
jgi:hypothetical protein